MAGGRGPRPRVRPGAGRPSFLVDLRGGGAVILGLFDHRGGAAGAVPRRLAAGAGRGLLREEVGKVEGGLGGGDTHGSSFPCGGNRKGGGGLGAAPERSARRCRGAGGSMGDMGGER